MPLVANYAPDPKEPGKLVPCGNAASPPADGCLIVGKNGTSGAQDSYSVLASFGAKFGGKSSGTTPEASVGIAQYFATGVAAQLLAAWRWRRCGDAGGIEHAEGGGRCHA